MIIKLGTRLEKEIIETFLRKKKLEGQLEELNRARPYLRRIYYDKRSEQLEERIEELNNRLERLPEAEVVSTNKSIQALGESQQFIISVSDV